MPSQYLLGLAIAFLILIICVVAYFPDLERLEFKIVKGGARDVYLVYNSTRWRISNPTTVAVMGYDFSELMYLKDQDMYAIPQANVDLNSRDPSFAAFLGQMKTDQYKFKNHMKSGKENLKAKLLSSSKVLIVTVDNRELNANLSSNRATSSYLSEAMAINFKYATLHNYDFIAISCNTSGLASELLTNFNITSENIARQKVLQDKRFDFAHDKDLLSVFNVKLKEVRASPWAKLPALAILLDQIVSDNDTIPYDLVFYVDSDLVINPSLHSMSISSILESILTNENSVTTGVPIEESSMLFFSNAPYAAVPCTGAIVLFPDYRLSRDLLIDWWDYDYPATNFRHEYEQASFWNMQVNKHRINEHYSYVHALKQFPPCDNQWLCHLGHPWRDIREKMLSHFLDECGLLDADLFARIIKFIDSNLHIRPNSLQMTEFVHAIATGDANAGPNPLASSWKTFRNAVKGQLKTDIFEGKNAATIKSLKRFEDDQFPAYCSSRKGIILKSLMKTSLGVMLNQVAYLLLYARSIGAVLIVDEMVRSPHFSHCPSSNVDGSWACSFEPMTNCTMGSINSIVITFKDAMSIESFFQHNLEAFARTKAVNEALAFLTRPSFYSLALAAKATAALSTPFGSVFSSSKFVAIHIHQKTSTSSKDSIESNLRLWNATSVLDICRQIRDKFNISSFLFVSDDVKLMNDTQKSSQNTGIHLATTMSILRHTYDENDCFHEVACNSTIISVVDAATTAIVELVLLSRSMGVATTLKSSYSRLILALNLWFTKQLLPESLIFDLDDEFCTFGGAHDQSKKCLKSEF